MRGFAKKAEGNKSYRVTKAGYLDINFNTRHALHDVRVTMEKQMHFRCPPRSSRYLYTSSTGYKAPKVANRLIIQIHKFPPRAPIRYNSRVSSTSSSGSSGSSDSSESSVGGVIVRTNPATTCRYASTASRFTEESYFSHFLKLFCRCLVFHPNLALMLLIQSSLLLPCGWTQAKGYLLALTVT